MQLPLKRMRENKSFSCSSPRLNDLAQAQLGMALLPPHLWSRRLTVFRDHLLIFDWLCLWTAFTIIRSRYLGSYLISKELCYLL